MNSKKMWSLAALAIAGAGLCLPSAAATAAPSPASASAVAGSASRADFDGDGFYDLAVGIPFENVGGVADAGAVQVMYGSVTGLNGVGDQLVHQNTPGVLDVAEPGDHFGAAVVAANFNGDAFTDLAIGVPLEDGTAVNQGGVHVLYGSANGLTSNADQFYGQATPGIADGPEAGDEFGRSLSAANFGRTAQADLAVGVPREDIGGLVDAGIVQTIYGTPNGLTVAGSQLLRRGAGGIGGAGGASDEFGLVLTAGNFGLGGQADLAVGVPSDDVSGIANAGSVHVIHGSTNGLTGVGDRQITQDTAGVADAPESQDRFGEALVAADLGRSSEADLAIGVPTEDHTARGNAGGVHVLYGAAVGLTGVNADWFTQATAGVNDAPDAEDRFGAALAAADFGRSSTADLAIGVPFEDATGVSDAGAVAILYGAATGVTANGDQLLNQDTPGLSDAAEAGDTFGASLTAANFGLGVHADLAVGVPGENVGAVVDAGAVQAIYGTPGGLSTLGNSLLHQDSLSVLDSAEPGDRFGTVVAAQR